MRKLLLDTCTFLWAIKNDSALGEQASVLLLDLENQIYVSAVSAWEIAIKQSLGKLHAPDDISAVILDKGFIPLSISPTHGDTVRFLPNLHRDPFDRMLVAQAQCEKMEILTADGHILRYPVGVINARN